MPRYSTPSLFLALLLLALLPGLALAQNRPGPRGPGGPGGMDPQQMNSVAFLLSQAEELSLTAAQKASLAALDERWTEDNAESLTAIRQMQSAGRRTMDRERMRSTMMRLRENDRTLVQEALSALSDDQSERARELLEQRRPRRGPPGGPGGV